MEQVKTSTQSDKFNDQIVSIKSQFFSALDDFKKYYVYYNKNPEVNEFQSNYFDSKNKLEMLSNNLFLLTNTINKEIQDLDSNMLDISLKLENEKKIYKKLTKSLNELTNKQNGSVILIGDSKEKYNKQYYKNIQIFIGILLIGGLLGTTTIFTPNASSTITNVK